MKVQFEGDILIGNHGAVVIRNWNVKGDEGETNQDIVIGMKRLVIERLELALTSLCEDIEKIQKGDPAALLAAATGLTKH